MARTRAEDSKNSFGGLMLEPEEEAILQKYLNEQGMSLNKLKRKLIRTAIADLRTKHKRNA